MPPNIRYGLGSFPDDHSWRCDGCVSLNLPTEHLIFMLPKFLCDCGQKFNGDFRISMDDIRINGHVILGKIHIQLEKRCVAYAYVHSLQILERLECIIMKGDPSLLEDLNPEKLFDMYEDRRSEMTKMGCSTKPVDNVRIVHLGLILKEDGLEGESAKTDNVHKVGDVTVIAKNDFEGIATALAEGSALVTTFYSGKRLRDLKYGQIYKAYRASDYKNKNKKLVGHAVCIIGAGREKGEEYYDVVNSHKKFCVRRDAEGNVLKFGVGRIRASDLKCNVIRLSRAAANGEDEWRLQPQTEIVLNDHNRHLMTRLKITFLEPRWSSLD
ncbi:unnamed protein product [Alopecurus aequalis]